MRHLDTMEDILGYDNFEITYPELKNMPILHLTKDDLINVTNSFENNMIVMELIRVYKLVKEGKI